MYKYLKMKKMKWTGKGGVQLYVDVLNGEIVSCVVLKFFFLNKETTSTSHSNMARSTRNREFFMACLCLRTFSTF